LSDSEGFMDFKYSIVTPVKNEEDYLPKTIDSVVNQTIRPQKWIIVDDGSTDSTPDIINNASSQHEWIERLDTGDSSTVRKPGGESVAPVGIKALNMQGLDFFVRMDGDLSFSPDYFKDLFSEFDKDPKLGIASGVCYVPREALLIEEPHPRFHTRGPIKTYRLQCYRDIDGVEAGLGFDTLDEIKANMLGWHTRSFPELKVIHHRPTQTASGALKGMINKGKAAYYLGYHPLYLFLRAIKIMTKDPVFIGGLCLLGSYLKGYLTHAEPYHDAKVIEYLRQQQMNRLLGRETIWK